VETCFPIYHAELKREVISQGLKLYLSDNVNTWQLRSDGEYQRLRRRGEEKSAQQILMEKLGTLLN
jgi:polyphosphate kinase